MAKAKPTAEDVLSRLRLPTSGEVAFVPPRHWRPAQPLPRGEQHGFIDAQGREWTKDPTRTRDEPFEWDVQLADGSHLNVSLTGRITHPRPRVRRRRGAS